jgi:flavodoxin
MANILITYWTGSGNTEQIATAINKKIEHSTLIPIEELTLDQALGYDIILFGCPAMGVEELEQSVVQPFWNQLKPLLTDKKLALFGSYGLGAGQWLTTWEKDAIESGVKVIAILAIKDNLGSLDKVRLDNFIKQIK